MSNILHSYALNSGATCAMLLTIRFMLLGTAWGWLFPSSNQAPAPSWINYCVKSAQNLLIGVLISLLTALLLAELGLFKPLWDYVVIGVLLILGMGIGVYHKRRLFIRHITDSVPGALGFWLCVLVVLSVPDRGEWIIGGWDPGVYVNQGICVADSGTFYPEAIGCYADLDNTGMKVFVRGTSIYKECFPGVPIDRESRAIQHYFFRLMPTFVAVMARCGGVTAATRANGVLGLMVLVELFACLIVNRCNIKHAFLACIMLGLQPIWLYHLHIPTSEMLQLFLLLSLGLLIPIRRQGPFPLFALALTTLAALLNRLSFLPFSAILLFLLSIFDFGRNDRSRVWLERVFLLVSIALGAVFDLFVTSVTILRLRTVLPNLLIVAGVFISFALLIDLVACHQGLRSRLSRLPIWVERAAAGCTILILCIFYFAGDVSVIAPFSNSLHGLLPYLGGLVSMVATAGACILFYRDKKIADGLKIILLLQLCVTLIVLSKGHIVSLYPFSTRRHLAYAVPMIAVFAGYVVPYVLDMDARNKLTRWGCACALLLCIFFGQVKKSWHAWSRTEYNGVSHVLEEVAGQISPRDVVVVDHPVWGTPLCLIYGKQVLNGKSFYNSKKKSLVMEAGMRVLAGYKDQGKKVRFLTTTGKGLEVFPLKVQPVTMDWESKEISYTEIIHSKRAKDFVLREKKRLFRLYTWKDPATSGSASVP